MAIEDYVPNIFGGVPVGYEGLLGADQSAALQKRSNLAGLLGFGAALAQGMGAGGARRSALQNVLTAAAQGFSGAGQTYEAGINQLLNRQKIAQSQYQLQAIEQLLQDPRVKDDPTMQAYIRANPAEAIKFLAENAPIQQALAAPTAPPPVSVAPAAAAMATPSGAAPSEDKPRLPEVAVEDKAGPDAALLAKKNVLLGQIERLSVSPSKRADEIIKRNQEQIGLINKELDRYAVAGFDFQAVENIVPQQFKGRVANLRQAAESGAITMNELTQRLQDIEQKSIEFVTKKTDYTNQDRRVAAGLFQGRAVESLNPTELMQLQNELDRIEIEKRRAGATVIDMGSKEMQKEFAKGVVEDTRTSFQQAKSAVNTVKTIQAIKPIISAGVYEGVLAGAPRTIDQLATAIGVSGKNTQEKLQRTAVAMQRLASLELQAAEAMKGQGAITENERSLIARAAAGNLRDFTSAEVQSLLDSLERVSRQKIESHQQNWEVMNSDPIGSKYSKFYKIESPPQKTLKYNKETGKIE
jgi:hypothetical protein